MFFHELKLESMRIKWLLRHTGEQVVCSADGKKESYGDSGFKFCFAMKPTIISHNRAMMVMMGCHLKSTQDNLSTALSGLYLFNYNPQILSFVS